MMINYVHVFLKLIFFISYTRISNQRIDLTLNVDLLLRFFLLFLALFCSLFFVYSSYPCKSIVSY
jgi:hypothetical protein